VKGLLFRIKKRGERITFPLSPPGNILVRPPEPYLSGFLPPFIKELEKKYTCTGVVNDEEAGIYEKIFERMVVFKPKEELPEHDVFINLGPETILSPAPVRMGVFPSVYHNLEIRGKDFPSMLAFIGRLLGVSVHYHRSKKRKEKRHFIIENPEIREILEEYPPHPEKVIMDLNPELSSIYLSSIPFIVLAPSSAWLPLERDGMDVVRYRSLKALKGWAREFLTS